MKLTAAGLTDPGKVRQNNEDNYWVDEDLGLLVVADGMGGHAAGEVASEMAVNVIREQVAQCLKTGRIPAMGDAPMHLSERAHLLCAVVRMANEVIFSSAQERVEKKGMGTTIVAVLAGKNKFSVAHVGDSRLYLFRGGSLRQVTRDHSLVSEQVAKGLMTAEQAERSDMKNVLTRALGIAPEVQVDLDEQPLQPGDVLLLCTDGLNRMADDSVIQEEMRKNSDPLPLCQRLIEIANERGGNDNVTIAAGRVEASGLWERLSGRFGGLRAGGTGGPF